MILKLFYQKNYISMFTNYRDFSLVYGSILVKTYRIYKM